MTPASLTILHDRDSRLLCAGLPLVVWKAAPGIEGLVRGPRFHVLLSYRCCSMLRLWTNAKRSRPIVGRLELAVRAIHLCLGPLCISKKPTNARSLHPHGIIRPDLADDRAMRFPPSTPQTAQASFPSLDSGIPHGAEGPRPRRRCPAFAPHHIRL